MSLAKSNPTSSLWMEVLFRPDWSLLAGFKRKTGDMTAVNIHDSKDACTIEAAVPGFAKAEISLLADMPENDIEANCTKGIPHYLFPRQQVYSVSPQTKTLTIR
jgi:HSP20 family molecular chaperone IbpA